MPDMVQRAGISLTWGQSRMLHGEANAGPSLRGVGLTRTFGSGDDLTTALSDVTIELYHGQLVLIMGPSGSGKSTMLAVLSGLLTPQAGKVYALGKDLWEMTEKQREAFRLENFGFIFQGYNLFPALTARQQLEMMLLWGKGLSRQVARQKADKMLDLLGLGKKANLRPAQLSGGEKQRVAIGRALIKEPAFCFADEPTSALDWKHGEQVIELLRVAAHDCGSTILVVGHDARMMPHVDRVFHMEDGVLSEHAHTSEMSGAHPHDRQTLRFAPEDR
jgi:putative ABC transport system ATP-binding protein